MGKRFRKREALLAAGLAAAAPHMEGQAQAEGRHLSAEHLAAQTEMYESKQDALDTIEKLMHADPQFNRGDKRKQEKILSAIAQLQENKSLGYEKEDLQQLQKLAESDLGDEITEQARVALVSALNRIDATAVAIVKDMADNGQIDDPRLLNQRSDPHTNPKEMLLSAQLNKQMQLEQEGAPSLQTIAEHNQELAEALSFPVDFEDENWQYAYPADVAETWALVSAEDGRRAAEASFQELLPQLDAFLETYWDTYPDRRADDQVSNVPVNSEDGEMHIWRPADTTAWTAYDVLGTFREGGNDFVRLLQAGGYTYDEGRKLLQPVLDKAQKENNPGVYVSLHWALDQGTDGTGSQDVITAEPGETWSWPE